MVSLRWKRTPTTPRLIDMLRIFTSASRARRYAPSAGATSSSDSRENQVMNGTCSWGALTTRPASSSGTSIVELETFDGVRAAMVKNKQRAFHLQGKPSIHDERNV